VLCLNLQTYFLMTATWIECIYQLSVNKAENRRFTIAELTCLTFVVGTTGHSSDKIQIFVENDRQITCIISIETQYEYQQCKCIGNSILSRSCDSS